MRDVAPGETVMGSPAVPIRDHHRQVLLLRRLVAEQGRIGWTRANRRTVVAEIDIQRIMEMIPHRYPFLLIDRVVDVTPGERATGIKNVSINEFFFQGHFPARPVMPGVLIVEAMAQTAAVLVVHTLGEASEGKLVYFMSVDSARFRRPVVPGDRLAVRVSCKQRNRGIVWKFDGRAAGRRQAHGRGDLCRDDHGQLSGRMPVTSIPRRSSSPARGSPER